MNAKLYVDMPDFDGIKNYTLEDQKKVLFFSMSKMDEIAHRLCPVDTEELRRSINLNPISMGATEYILSVGKEYGIPVEYGRSPGTPPPIDSLKLWSRRKLGDENAAYAVAKKIAKYGTKAHPFMRPAFMEVKNIWMPRYWSSIISKD